MQGLLQPTHLFFILLIVLIVFGAGDLSRLGRGFARPQRGLWSRREIRRGASPDITDLSKHSQNRGMVSTARRWLKFLIAILLGNGLYFALYPYLPPLARHRVFRVDLGTVVDLWFCLFVYGLLELVSFLRQRRKHPS